MARLSFSQNLEWRKTDETVWYLIVQPNCVLNGERPEADVGGVVPFPVKGRVDHKCPHPVAYSLNAAFSNHILVFGTNSQKQLRLPILFVTVVTKSGGVVHSIITVIMLNGDAAKVPHLLLEMCLAQDILAFSHVTLKGDKNIPRGTVDIDSASAISIFCWFLPRNGDVKLIRRDHIAGLILVPFENTLFVLNWMSEADF